MSSPITEPGWYRAGPRGLERVCGLEDLPGDISELVKVEFSEQMAEVPLW